MHNPVTKNVENYILTAAEREADLRPALLFNGNLSEHRARTLFCLTQFMRDNHITKIGQGLRLVDAAIDVRHLTGSHAKKQDAMSWARWLTRLKASPKVFTIDPPLKEYVSELWNSINWKHRFPLVPISELADRTRREWRKRPSLLPMTEHYPFSHENLSDNLLWLVHSAVPKYFTEDIRADVCQDLVVSVLAGEVSRLNLGKAVPKILKKHRAMYGDKWRTISLETPIYDSDGSETPVTLGDFLED